MVNGADIPAEYFRSNFDQNLRRLAGWRKVSRPLFYGLENIPTDGPVLFVGNHTLTGVLDAPLMVAEIYKHKGLLVRSLGDRFHFMVPVWRSMVTRFGGVEGSPDNFRKLMARREAVLVFPGGGREVAKRRGEQYQLIWKQRMGFARLCIEAQCPIVPFSAVGADDAYDIVFDASDYQKTLIGTVIEQLKLREEVMLPVLKGLWGTPIPKPERLYFKFSPVIHPGDYGHDATDVRAVQRLRDRVKESVEQGIQELRSEQQQDPERNYFDHLRAQVLPKLLERISP